MIILLDQDSVIYDIFEPWLALYNKDHPDDIVTPESFTGWDMHKICRYDIYSYLDNVDVYNAEAIIKDSLEVTKKWAEQGHQIVIVTTVVGSIGATPKLQWIKKNFPHIKDAIVVNGHLKHLISGDVLIDDGLHNLEDFKGVRVLFDQPWNRSSNRFLRAYDWQELDKLISSIDLYRRDFYLRDTIEYLLKHR